MSLPPLTAAYLSTIESTVQSASLGAVRLPVTIGSGSMYLPEVSNAIAKATGLNASPDRITQVLGSRAASNTDAIAFSDPTEMISSGLNAAFVPPKSDPSKVRG